MEKVLQKLAQQLNSYDEASLMSLWEKYANWTNQFEPSKRWEEAALIFCLIQAVHWKNQLFNHNLSQTVFSGKPDKQQVREGLSVRTKGSAGTLGEHPRGIPPEFFLQFPDFTEDDEAGEPDDGDTASGSGQKLQKGCKILPFRLRNPGKS